MYVWNWGGRGMSGGRGVSGRGRGMSRGGVSKNNRLASVEQYRKAINRRDNWSQ